MAQREGSVYLYLFIATFVLFVGGIVAFFFENAAKNTLQLDFQKLARDKADAEQRATKNSKDLDALRELVGGAEVRGTAWPGDDVYKQKLSELETFLNEIIRKPTGQPPKALGNMYLAYADYKDMVNKIIDSRQHAEERQKRAVEDLKVNLQANQKEVKGKEDLISNLKGQVSETESKYEKKIAEQTRENERLQKELVTIKDQLASEQIEATRKLQFSENVKSSLQVRLNQLMEESRKTKTIEDIEPDGKILQVASASQIGWVDIGRKDHLRPGLEFRIFQTVKGGKRQYKGRLEIRRVDETISEFRIVDTIDELNPITQGDYITSPFYDPRAVPVFVLAGEGLDSKDVTEETLRAKIKSYGAEIRTDVDLGTSFLIALKNYDKSPLYNKARELGIAVVREREILEYMGL